MPGMIPQETRGLGVGERRRLTGLLRAQVPSELDKAGGEPNAYPRCGGTHLAYEEHDRDGSQGRSCGRTLSRKAMGPLGYPESEEDVWATYAGRACAGGTLRECARACGVCRGTSWLMRTEASKAAPWRLPGGDSRLLPGGRHEPRRVAGRQAARIGGGIAPEAAALDGAVRDAREARGLPGAPRGVPPGRLGHYPGWFLWDEQTRRSDADRADTLSGQAATGSYDNTRFALAREPQPLWSYWEDKLAVSTVI